MKRIITFVFVIAACATMHAEVINQVQMANLYYNLDTDSQNAEVTYGGEYPEGYYSGAITIPETIIYNDLVYTVTSIGNEAFANSTELTSVAIPHSVTTIGEWAFYRCSNLVSIDLGSSVKSIGSEAFERCSILSSISIPKSVTSIGGGAFLECPQLMAINVATDNPVFCSEDGILFTKDKTTILTYPNGKQGAYIIPNTVTSIGNSAFRETQGLTSVKIPAGVTVIEMFAFFNCRNLTEINIPNKVTKIGKQAFSYCMGLSSIYLGNSVTSIGNSTFLYCSNLKDVYLPNSLTNIDEFAFAQCYNLTNIYNRAAAPQVIVDYVFSSVNQTACTLHVPEASVEKYKAANVWKKFAVQAITEEFIDCSVNYIDKESNVLSNEQISLHLPEAPSFTGFTFLRWDVIAGQLADGITLKAVYIADEPTDAPEIVNPINKSQKLIRKGNVYILTDTKTYTIQGLEVQ